MPCTRHGSQKLHDETRANTFKYLRPSRGASNGVWSAQTAGLHPRQISATFGANHDKEIQSWQRESMCRNARVRLVREACGYRTMRCAGLQQG
eukprot:6202659-Pleurochrysis_carterae.AAC.4